jgi:hypothetical protein
MARIGSRIAKVRLPADLAAAIDRFAARAQGQSGELNASGVLRLLLRAGLAADAGQRIDLRDAGYNEGWLAGHAQAVETHQRALHDAQKTMLAANS